MLSMARAERKAARLVNTLDVDDLYDQIETLRGYVAELSSGLGKNASRQFGRARVYASDTAHDAEEMMKDNLAASLVLAVGLGVLVGYFIRRGSE
ncbi:MAG: hypothetical protein WBW51_08005 [Methyloceanibacter sp.]